jgi:hypothetical protein
MKKVKQLIFGTTMEEEDNNGKSFILTRKIRLDPRASTKSSVSISTDHSTLDPECQ